MLLSSRTHKLSVNLEGQDYFVGDVHGQVEMLEALLFEVSFDKTKDRLIAVGDLIDRGPGSVRLLEMLAREPWFYSVMGNHEVRMLHSHPVHGEPSWFDDGGLGTYQQLATKGRVPGDYFQVLRGMPIALEVPLTDGRHIGVVHAEVPENLSWDDLFGAKGEPDFNSDCVWGRSRAMAAETLLHDGEALHLQPEIQTHVCANLWPVAGIDLVVTGHTPTRSCHPVAVSNMLNIDTGACYNGNDGGKPGRLTLVNLLSGQYWQAQWLAGGWKFMVVEHALPNPIMITDAHPTMFAALLSMVSRRESHD